MSNINNQFKNLYAIPGIKDLSDETAAAYSGGVDVILYSRPNFKGVALPISDPVRNLASFGFDDATSSIKVLNGKWRFWTDDNFQGNRTPPLPRGNYPSLGSFNNDIESLRAV